MKMRYAMPDIPVMMSIGVCEHEKKTKQKIVVSLSWKASLGQNVMKDDLDSVVDYREIYEYVKSWENHPHIELLEKVYLLMQTELQEKFPKLKNLSLTLEKQPFSDASIRIWND